MDAMIKDVCPFEAGDVEGAKRRLVNYLVRIIGKDPAYATVRDWFYALSCYVRGRLGERWPQTTRHYYEPDFKVVYYLSMEFLIGRSLKNNLLNLGILDTAEQVLAELGIDRDRVYACESDAALGNGGLGRLAACFLDSLSTQAYPACGYGIRYDFGMFHQRLDDGWQVERPEMWLRYGNPWEFERPSVMYPIHFGGRVVKAKDVSGAERTHWIDTDEVMAMAYDTQVAGYRSPVVNKIRLWSAKATRVLNLKHFNEGNYFDAVHDKTESESISKVLYPNDTTEMGKELRLRQEYFFVSASLQDILVRFTKVHESFDRLPDKVAIQLNDTHPALAIPEMMRLLRDAYGVDWDTAWDLTTRVFGYTNHTLLPEALETWPVAMFETLLPRHLQIIYRINEEFLKFVKVRAPGDRDILRRVSLIGEEGQRHVRMAHVAVVGSHKTNGVAALHAELMRKTTFADFELLFPGRIVGKTNGITPRRWLNQANPGLAAMIRARIGDGWVTRLDELEQMLPLADDGAFQDEFRAVKADNKQRLASLIADRLDVVVDPSSLFDVQVKRIHEYKRQLLNVFHVIARYNRIRDGDVAGLQPRTVVFAGKAAPGYVMAKLVIKLINDVAAVVNADPQVGDLLKVVFIPNYDVSTAEVIIPAVELSEQISTAGTEASGTGNMKMALNGALTIGTRDGANIEIGRAVGEENIFFFGLDAGEVTAWRDNDYDPWACYHGDEVLRRAFDMVRDGYFAPDEPDRFHRLTESITEGGDRYMVMADFPAFLACQQRVDAEYADAAAWTRKAIINMARMGPFSSDRTIREYADDIWGVVPLASG